MTTVEDKIELTVITAVRNALSSAGVDALRRCVNSIAALNIPHEHIMQDGISTDGTLRELDNLKKDNPNLVVRSEKDTGIYNALNKAIKVAKGKWMYVLGVDDYIVSAEDMAAALRRGIESQADIVVSKIFISNTDDVRKDDFKPSGMLRSSFFSCMPYPHQGMLVRKSVIERLGGFNECYRMASDYDLTIRALLLGVRVVECERPYAYYCTEGLSSTDSHLDEEYAEVRSSLFKITHAQAVDLGKRRILPWRVWLRYCLRTEQYFRRAIRFHVIRNLANDIGLLGENGALRWKDVEKRPAC